MSVLALRVKEHTLQRTVRPVAEQIAVSNDTLLDVDYKLTLDENRFIISEFNKENKGLPKVFLLGDSIAECAYVPEGERITDLLNKFTQQEIGCKYEYLNAACSGNTTLHLVTIYLAKIMPLNPKHVIMMLGSIDASACRKGKNYWTPVKGTTPFTHTDDSKKYPGKVVDFSYREALVAGVNSMCKAMESHLHIATIPVTPKAQWHMRENIVDSIDTVIEMRQEINENTRHIAKKHHISLIDLDLRVQSKENMFYDVEHMNAYGSLCCAQEINKYLIDF